MEFFNFKQKQQVVTIQKLKKEVASIDIITVNVIETEKDSNDINNYNDLNIIKTVINHTYDKNTVNDVLEYCNYIFSRRVVNVISKEFDANRLYNIGVNISARLDASSLNKIDKTIRKIAGIPFDSSKLVLCDVHGAIMYDYDTFEHNFEKIEYTDLNVDYKNLNIQSPDLKSDLNKLDNYCNSILKDYVRTINADLSLLTTKLTKLEKELNQELKGAGENIANDINKTLKIVGNITRYSSNMVIDVNNTINFFINGLIKLINKIVKQ